MKKIDLAKAPRGEGCRYPAPHDGPCRQRHWHSHEDEFIHVLEGEVVLITDAGEEILRPGDSAGFAAGVRDGHCLQNRTREDARILVVGSRSAQDYGEYPDLDMKFLAGRYSGGRGYVAKNADRI